MTNYNESMARNLFQKVRTNAEFAHKCFYTEKENISHENMSKRGNKLYSYNTCVGWISHKFRLTLVSSYYFSSTTCKHLNYYKSASKYKVFSFDFYDRDIVFDKARNKKELYSQIAEAVIYKIEKRIEYRKANSANKNKKKVLFYADEKREVLFMLNNLDKLAEYLECKNSIKNQKKIDKFKNEIFLIITKNKTLSIPFFKKDDQTRLKIATNCIRTAFKDLSTRHNIDFNLVWNDNLKKFINNFEFSKIIDRYVKLMNMRYNSESNSIVSCDSYTYLDNKFVNSILKLICAKDSKFHNESYSTSPAFLACNNNRIITSKHICMEKEIVVERFLSLWLNPNFNRKKAVGHKVGNYEVCTVEDDYVRIGCHLFPTFILEDFAEFLLNKKDEEQK